MCMIRLVHNIVWRLYFENEPLETVTTGRSGLYTETLRVGKTLAARGSNRKSDVDGAKNAVWQIKPVANNSTYPIRLHTSYTNTTLRFKNKNRAHEFVLVLVKSHPPSNVPEGDTFWWKKIQPESTNCTQGVKTVTYELKIRPFYAQ